MFFTRVFCQNDTTDINTLNAKAWKLRSSNLDTSIVLSNQALVLLNTLRNNEKISSDWKDKAFVKTQYYLGFFYSAKGENNLAMDYFNKALLISNKLNYAYGKALVIGGIGALYLRQGNFSKALENYFKALQLDEKRGNKEAVLVRYGNIGVVYDNQGNYKKALEYYEKALHLAEELKDKNRISIQLGNIGIVYFEQHNLSKALEFYNKALAIEQEEHNKHGVAINLNNIAAVYKEQKDYDKSLNYFLQALQIGEEQGDVNLIASSTGNIGLIYFEKRDYKKSEEYLLKTLKLAQEIESLDLQNEFELEASNLYAAQGKYKLALEHFKKHEIAKDSIFNTENTEKNVRTEMNYEFEKKQAIDNAVHQKQLLLLEAENKTQKQLRLFLVVILCLALLLLFFARRAYINKHKIAKFLTAEGLRKEVLLQEVHHRINNNLQIISSLLTLQANSAGDDRLHSLLTQSQNRIQSLSALHELLYQQDSPIEINMNDYLNKVLDFHRDVLLSKNLNIQLVTNIAPIHISTKLAVPLALIVNELVTNSIKYAFINENQGHINISFYNDVTTKNMWILSVSDNGQGLPVDTVAKKESLGLRLVTIMSKQIGGVLTKTNSPGATFSLSFSLTK